MASVTRNELTKKNLIDVVQDFPYGNLRVPPQLEIPFWNIRSFFNCSNSVWDKKDGSVPCCLSSKGWGATQILHFFAEILAIYRIIAYICTQKRQL